MTIHFLWHFVGLFCTSILVLAVGCEDGPSSPIIGAPNKSHSGSSVFNSSVQTVLNPPPDYSLSLNEYINAGIPAYDRTWTGDDKSRALDVLVAIASENATHLPRFKSKNSGETFKRITANDNLNFYRNQDVPIENRLQDFLSYSESSSQILKLYLIAFNQNAVGDSELVELYGEVLQIAMVMIQLVNEFLPTLDKSIPDYQFRMEGLEKIKDGLATAVAGSLQMLSDSETYRSSELKRLVKYMEGTFPEILPELPNGGRVETLNRLQSFLIDPEMKDLEPEIESLLTLLKKSSVR